MPLLRINAGSCTFDARLEEALAPKTCATFRSRLPFGGKIIHVRWSGEARWMPLGNLDFGVGHENPTSYPAPGQVLLHPRGVSETGLLLARWCRSFYQQGRSARQSFPTLTSALENLAELGRTRRGTVLGHPFSNWREPSQKISTLVSISAAAVRRVVEAHTKGLQNDRQTQCHPQ